MGDDEMENPILEERIIENQFQLLIIERLCKIDRNRKRSLKNSSSKNKNEKAAAIYSTKSANSANSIV